MATNVEFLDPKRVRVDTSVGDSYILGFNNSMNYQIDQQWDGFFTKCVIGLFDKYYKGDERQGSYYEDILKAVSDFLQSKE